MAFFYYFKNPYGFNITDFISVVESDHGKALKKSCDQKNILNFNEKIEDIKQKLN